MATFIDDYRAIRIIIRHRDETNRRYMTDEADNTLCTRGFRKISPLSKWSHLVEPACICENVQTIIEYANGLHLEPTTMISVTELDNAMYPPIR